MSIQKKHMMLIKGLYWVNNMKANSVKFLFSNNPVFILGLGIVPILGASVYAYDALAMGIITLIVLFFSSLFALYIREYINSSTSIFLSMIISAVIVTILQVLIKLWDIELYNRLGIYFPLVVVNSLILSEFRQSEDNDSTGKEVLLSSVKSGISFIVAIVLLGIMREFLGNGTIFSLYVLPEGFPKMLIMQTSMGGFLGLGLLSLLAQLCRKEN